MVQTELHSYFPRLISYERFVITITKVLPGLFLFLQYRCRKSQFTSTYFVDSKKLPVCDNRRIHFHRVFADIVSFLLTPGNVADNNHQVLHYLLDHLKGHCIGDKGYLSALFEHFYERGLHLITKVRAKMKTSLCPWSTKSNCANER
ncbi:transposase [Spirosoma foliorum]|uniref:Transposase n=1 Tax=Spirosoma foliorum TaxID=2710596 RepID=A0A7G5GYU9_9BACT|nr:transposase [Spirosoma foliorum]